eukprot:TRINITY_DN32355_c1_g1_i5.p1 TRINITY_DN32355_c1_g1~~TRINITY_DN32355_c1_g1_i5.p1  ORF type:complete len:329 (-),score=42.77 TRINITY_DN32355_c1_g1_i5:440-1426(-)
MRPYVLKGHARPLNQIRFNREGDLLFTCAKDKHVCVWFTENGERLGTYNGHNGAVWTCDMSIDSKILITGSGDQTTKIWNLETGEELFSIDMHVPCRNVRFSVGDKQALITTDPFATTKTSSISIIDIYLDILDEPERQSGEVRQEYKNKTKITRALWTDANSKVIFSQDDGVVKIWDVETGKIIAENQVHEMQISDVQMSADGTHCITSSHDKTAKLIDTQTLEVLKSYKHDRPVYSAALHPTLDHIVMGGGQDAADVTTTAGAAGGFESRFCHKIYEEEFGRVRGHFGPVNTVTYSPDGRSFVTGGEDGFVRLQHFDMDYFTTRFF